MRKFKVGDNVECITKPSLGSYQAKVGQRMQVSSLSNTHFYSTEARSICGYTTPCYLSKLFKRVVSNNIIGGTAV